MKPRAESRVLLRPPRATDGPAFVALVRASGVFLRPWSYPPATLAGFRKYQRMSRTPTYQGLLLVRREDGALLGTLNLSQIFRGSFRSAYLGYWIGRPHAGRGFMTEGMELLLRCAFGKLRLHRIEANVQPGNAASRALVRRCGFRKEGFSPRYLKVGGRWRDHERWAITAEDFRALSRVRPRRSGIRASSQPR